mmetsp:Transcript_96770/g.301283  ORF Transcript_96770/g.301283 Transcript_96770/m.301283 type:complete len:259 (+) Transcript_96770:565-1341(+)
MVGGHRAEPGGLPREARRARGQAHPGALLRRALAAGRAARRRALEGAVQLWLGRPRAPARDAGAPPGRPWLRGRRRPHGGAVRGHDAHDDAHTLGPRPDAWAEAPRRDGGAEADRGVCGHDGAPRPRGVARGHEGGRQHHRPRQAPRLRPGVQARPAARRRPLDPGGRRLPLLHSQRPGTYEDGRPTGALPGCLVKNPRSVGLQGSLKGSVPAASEMEMAEALDLSEHAMKLVSQQGVGMSGVQRALRGSTEQPKSRL